MVVGCGALGNEVLKNLALMGIKNIVIIDFDKVEAGNLSRSVLFNETDNVIGKNKVEVAARALRKIDTDIKLTLIYGDIGTDVGLGLIKDVDVVIGCVDNRRARYCINRMCMRARKPWIDGGISQLEGMVRIFEPDKSCYACSLSSEHLLDLKKRFSCSGNISRSVQTESAPTTPVIASVIGAIQVQEALKLIQNKTEESTSLKTLSGKMFYYDGKHLTSGTATFEAFDDDCPVHEPWEPIIESSITANSTVKEAVTILQKLLGTETVSILLINDCFVDYIFDKETDKEYEVMLPGRKIEEFITDSPILNRKPVSAYYQNEIWSFSENSLYNGLTLNKIGVPSNDIIKVKCYDSDYNNYRYFYIRMQ